MNYMIQEEKLICSTPNKNEYLATGTEGTVIAVEFSPRENKQRHSDEGKIIELSKRLTCPFRAGKKCEFGGNCNSCRS